MGNSRQPSYSDRMRSVDTEYAFSGGRGLTGVKKIPSLLFKRGSSNDQDFEYGFSKKELWKARKMD